MPARQSHDYERHDVTALFAALDVASGVTISHCYRRHRHQEFLRFLQAVDANPGHPRYHVPFTPTGASWLNLLERLFAEGTERCVRHGSHTAVGALEQAMLDYLDRRNRNPRPFSWTADADLILGKVQRLCKRISDSGH